MLRLPSEEQVADTIQAKEDFKNLLEHPGWKRLQNFISTQEDGILQSWKIGIRPDTLFGKTRIQKYDDMQSELKAYKKILKFVEMSIQNGIKYERRLAKSAEASQ